MERRRAAAALLVLAACIACSLAAPTASNPTALELHNDPSEGCYYNFQHYGEGDRIMTNEPCLNCTCHNRMLMCYLRVCPFTKAIGQDCTVEKRADQCCPIVTCPDVPVDLLTSTSTSSPAEYGPTGVGKLDKYGCSIHNKYFPEGSKVPSSPNKPCEHCYCIRNMTTCVMQECTLHVDGCTPIYHKDVCCPVRYSCDHSEDEIRLLDDMTTTVRPTQGFLLTTTTMLPVTQMTQDCVHDEQIFPDGASIKTDKACEHCYCMKGDIVCVVQECGTPMENEGKNCTSLPPRQGQCCPDTYICEGDEPSLDLTTQTIDLTSVPPRRLGVEGSGYRNEPDEPITEKSPFEHDIEGSGDVTETDMPTKVPPSIRDELLTTTEKEPLYSETTEADKKLDTITEQISEKEPSVTFKEESYTGSTESVTLTSTESKVTVADEIIISDGVTSKHEDDIIDTETPSHSYEQDEILPTDISIDKATSLTLPEQSTTIGDDSGYSVTETSIKKETESTVGSTDSVVPYDITTTERPTIFSITEKDNSKDESHVTNKIDIISEITNADISVTEQNKPDFDDSTVKELYNVDDATTVSSIKDVAETTAINPVDNEVDYVPGRIPGEGDCLLNGVTYSDNTSVPSTNNCHTGCKCISSIIKCDPIICSPPPEYMENMNDCQTSYDSPDACCPTFACSPKETSLPQSHSQTSVTESSKPVVEEECNGNDCSSDEVKQPSIEPHKICDSGKCETGPIQSECGVNGCQGEEHPPLEHPVHCTGDKCTVSPTVSCDGENCETAPTEEKEIDDKIHSVPPNEPVCNDDGGCDNVKDTSSTPDECKDDSCKRPETFETDKNINAECSGAQCKVEDEQKIPLSEPTITPVTESIFNGKDTETHSEETQEAASPLPNIVTSEMAIPTESIKDIDIEQVTAKDQLPDKTLTDVIVTEEPIKLITENAIGVTDDTITKTDNTDRIVTSITDNPQEEIIKSEISPTQPEISPTPLIPMSDSATEIIKTSDESSTEQGPYSRAPGQDETEAYTESRFDTSENKDTSSQEYTKEVSQTTTQKSETHSDMYETKSDEFVTQLPIIMDVEKDKNPNSPTNEVKETVASEDYPITTEKLEAISVSDESEGITLKPTKTQDNEPTVLPESTIEVGSGNEDHSELIPTEAQDVTSKIIQDDKTEDYNKITTAKSITSPEVTENPTAAQTEPQSILSETVSSESTFPTISTDIHEIYTDSPQTIGTKSDSDSYITVKLDESDNSFKEPTTPSSGAKQEEFSTKLDETISGDGPSENENQEYATTERKPSILNDDKLNVDLNLDVTETTIPPMKHTDENEIDQDIQTKLPIVDKITESTVVTDSQTISPLDDKATDLSLNNDFTVTESAHQYTSNEGAQPTIELASKDQNLDLLTSTTSPVLRDEGGIEITSSTDKNEIKVTSSDETVTETKYISDVAEGEKLTTPLPNDNIEQHHPTKDLKLTTVSLEIPLETTTSVLISEEKQQTPDLEVPDKTMEEENERKKDMTTELPPFTKDIIDEHISSSKLPELISSSEDTSGISSDNEKATANPIYNTKEEDITENNLEAITHTTISNIHISESVTEKINTQPQEQSTQESSAEGSSAKPDVNENDLITESPYSETGSIDFDKYSTITPDEYEVNETPKLPVSEVNNDIKPMSTSIPLMTQDDKIVTEKSPIPSTAEKETTTEKSEYDRIPDKDEQPPVAMSTESNTDHDIFQNTVTEDKQIEIVEKVTEISPTAYESETNTSSSGSVPENENPSSEVLKQTTEMQYESELTTQQELQTVASIPKDQSITELPSKGMPTSDQTYTSSSKSDIEIEDVGTTDSVPIKQDDLPGQPQMPVENIYAINDLTTTQVVPLKHDDLPKHPETTSIDTVLPELNTAGDEEGINKIDSATLTTDSLITSKPLLITSTEASKTDTTKLTDMLEEQPLPSKIPEPIVEITPQTETESVTEQEFIEPYTTEKQYVSKSDQEEVPKIPELPEEQVTAQTDTETASKQEDFGAFTTEKQYMTESDHDDIPKIPELVDEQSNSQSDIESVTKFEDTESYNTEKQYVTESHKEVPEISKLPEEPSTDPMDTEFIRRKEDSQPFTTERTYVTKLDQENPELPVQIDEQSTSRTDIESVTELEDIEPMVTEKQYVTISDQENVPKFPVLVDEQSTSQSDIESVTKQEDTEPMVTEKQYVTKSEDDNVPKISEPTEEQSTSQSDTEFVTKLNDIEPYTTEKQYVTKSEEDKVPKIPEPSEEQSTSQSDTEFVTKLNDIEPYTTEKQYVTKSEEDKVPKIPEPSEEQSTSQSDTEFVTKLNDIEPYTTEKQYVTKSEEDKVPKIPEPSEEQSTARTDTESVSNQEDYGSITTEKQYVTKLDQEDIPKFPLVDEQSTSQSDIESVTKLDDTEPFVTEKQYVTKLEEDKVPKISESSEEQSTSQSDIESMTKLNDMGPYTTENQYETKTSEEVPEIPELPKKQSTDRTDTEIVSKTEDAGPFTTETPYVTKQEQEVPKAPEQIEDQSTSRYDSESVTKLEDTEPFVTEKQYVSNADQEETPKFPVLSEEQSTTRIDTESVTKMEDSGTDHEETSSHKLDTDVTQPEQDIKNTEKITTEPFSYPDTTVKSELEGSDLFKPSEDVTGVPHKEDSPEIATDVSTSIPQKVETPIKTDIENEDDLKQYSTERTVQTSVPADETVILEEVTEAKPYEIEHKTTSKSSTEEENIYSETTPYSILLEEHTHPAQEDTSSIIPIEEGTTVKNEEQPERGDQVPDTPDTNDEYERTTSKPTEDERTTSYEKISSPIVHSSDVAETPTSVENIPSGTDIQDEDKKYTPSMQDEGLTTPVVLPTIKDKEEHTTSPTMLEKEITTLGGIIESQNQNKPELTSSIDTQELPPSSTSKLQEESTTHLPPSEDKYKEKPIPSPSPSSSEMPDILEEPHEDEHLPDFPPSGTGGGYGQEPDYVEEDQSFGPGTCRYGGKVYVSAQQIPRDDPCDFCFCFRSDIICLQQSCPPPIHGCHEEPIQGFCCPRYECPVSMATTMNVTTTTTTTTTTLPPHFLPHAYKGAAQRRGCQIKGHSYKVGEVVRASSGPCLHCTCGGDGQMKCDPKVCTPEPMLRQMIAAAVSSKRRR